MNITWHLPTLQEHGCGLSTRAIRLAEQLRSFGHHVSFVVDASKTNVQGETICGMPLRRVKIHPPFVPHWSLQAIAKRRSAVEMVRKIGRGHDLLITGQPEVAAAYAGRSDRGPLVFVCGGSTLLHDQANRLEQAECSLFGRILFRIDRALKHRNESQAFLLSDASVFDSLHTRDRVVAEYGASPDRCTTVHGGVDDEAYQPATPDTRAATRRELGLSDDAFVVAWTGRLSPEKNVELLLRAIPHCKRKPDRVYLLGDGPDRQKLESLSDTLCLGERVRWMGLQADVQRFLHAADVFVFPSRGESFGGSIIEAMACGLACVAIRPDGVEICNATAEILEHGVNGWVVDAARPTLLAEAMDFLAADASLRAGLGTQARRKASMFFSWRRGGEDLNELLSRVTGGAEEAGETKLQWIREDRLRLEQAMAAEG